MQLQLDYDDWVEEKAHELINRAQNELDDWDGEPFIPVERIASVLRFCILKVWFNILIL